MNTEHLARTLLRRAQEQPATVAYEFVDDGGSVTSMTCEQLAVRSLALAGELAATGPAPALIVCPQGLEYVVAVFAGFLAGVPVVPAYPPQTADAERLSRIIADAGVGSVVSTGPDPVSALHLPATVARITVPPAPSPGGSPSLDLPVPDHTTLSREPRVRSAAAPSYQSSFVELENILQQTRDSVV